MASPERQVDELGQVTQLLRRIDTGDELARNELFDLLYPELHRVAQNKIRSEREDHTLQATALVHEAFMRIAKPGTSAFKDRKHFLLTSARAMRHVLVDHARSKSAAKRTAKLEAVPLDQIVIEHEGQSIEIEALEGALAKLEQIDPMMARAVELRFFCGADVAETSEAIGIPRRTFDSRWKSTREWLRERLL